MNIQIPVELLLNELREENSQLSYQLAVARAQIRVLQSQQAQGGEADGGDAQPDA